MTETDTSVGARELGALTEVELRGAGPHEASAFTAWLAQEENLARLGRNLRAEIDEELIEACPRTISLPVLAIRYSTFAIGAPRSPDESGPGPAPSSLRSA